MHARDTNIDIWAAADELVARCPSPAALRRHRLELLAAQAARLRGLPVDDALRQLERVAALRCLAVPSLLSRIREVLDGPLVLMKGPEAGAAYPSPRLRPFKDLDILTPDPEGARDALLRSGFAETEELAGPPHHVGAVVLPGLPLTVELHRTPHYVLDLQPPSTESLLLLTRPSVTGIPGVLGFTAPAHAILLAIHAWAHGPLQQIGHLLDIAAILNREPGSRAEADELASEWGCRRLWRTTLDCCDAMFAGERPRMRQRMLASHLPAVREPSVLSTYSARVMSPVWGLSPARVLPGICAELGRTVLPYEGEPWTAQLGRSRRALSNTFRPLSAYR